MNKMFNFNGMPYKRSGRAGGKSVSMIGMLVLLLAALLVLPSCTGDDTETIVTETVTETVTVTVEPPPSCDELGSGLNEGWMILYDRQQRSGLHLQVRGAMILYTAGGGNDMIEGGEGNDNIMTAVKARTISMGGAGEDTITGGPNDDS